MIADSYIEIAQFRLLVLHTAWQIDQYQDYNRVRKDIAAIKVLTSRVMESVARRAIQVHGALGTTYDLPLTRMLASGLMLALADGPTEVHQTTVAKQVLRGYKPADGLWPSEYIPARKASRERPNCSEKTTRSETARSSVRTERCHSKARRSPRLVRDYELVSVKH